MRCAHRPVRAWGRAQWTEAWRQGTLTPMPPWPYIHRAAGKNPGEENTTRTPRGARAHVITTNKDNREHLSPMPSR